MGNLSVVRSLIYNIKFPFTDVSHFSEQQAEDEDVLGLRQG
jgi:hypothetical protein